MPLSAAVRAHLAERLAAAPHGAKSDTARALAETYGVSMATVYRAADLGGPKRTRDPQRPEYRVWVKTAVWVQERAPKRIPMDVAIEAAIEGGQCPPEAADMPLRTAYRLAREMNLTRRTKRTHRLHADYPMQAILFDASTSEHLVVDKALGDGDYRLKLHRRPLPKSGYKNKPLGPDRLRVVVYGIWDMCTGSARAVYVVERGESAVGAADSLCRMLAETGDPARPMHGVPDDLWSDQGPLWKSAASRALLRNLDIHLVTGAPYAKERMGGVERAWRTQWTRFERALFLLGEDVELTLSGLNERLREFERRQNATRMSRTPVAGRQAARAAAWVALTNARPADNRLRKLPDDPIRTMAQEAKRTLDANGIVRWDNRDYECTDPEWHSRPVTCYRRMDGSGDITLQDPATKERRVARLYEPRRYNEVRTAPKTTLDKLLDEDRAVPAVDVYATRAEPEGVVRMPARSAPAEPLDNPLDAGRCKDLATAMRLFCRHYPYPLSPANREAVAAELVRLELKRSAVVALANEMTALSETG